MMSSDKDKLFDDLIKRGLLSPESKPGLSVSFEDFVDTLNKESDELIKEVIRIKQKRDSGEELSFIEEKFLLFFKKRYAY